MKQPQQIYPPACQEAEVTDKLAREDARPTKYVAGLPANQTLAKSRAGLLLCEAR